MPASYLACEGPHDAALLGRLLENGGFSLQKKRSVVATGPFGRLVSGGIPDALFGRDPLPNFWTKRVTPNDPASTHWVAVHPVGGDGELPKALARITAQTSGALAAVGAFVDADTVAPTVRAAALQAAVIAINAMPGFSFSGVPGAVTAASAPRTGIYVMPDNVSTGSVEGVLEVCAQATYSNLHQNAGIYVAAIDHALLSDTERTRFAKGSNPRKAYLGVIGSVLRPGSAIQNTIRDDRWIDATTLSLPLVVQLRTFVGTLLNDPAI